MSKNSNEDDIEEESLDSENNIKFLENVGSGNSNSEKHTEKENNSALADYSAPNKNNTTRSASGTSKPNSQGFCKCTAAIMVILTETNIYYSHEVH